jgi:multiple sugar transport system ATP-binding protein
VIAPAQVLLAGKRFPVEGPMADAIAHRRGHILTAGLRAEHLRLAPATNRNLPAEVAHGEALGNEQLLTCRLLEGDHLVLVRAAADTDVSPGGRVHLEVDPEGWRFFDSTGEALPRS